MIFSKYIDFIYIGVGAFIAIYAQAEEQQNTLILIFGIVILMFGLYRVSSRIPSKNKNQHSEDELKNEL